MGRNLVTQPWRFVIQALQGLVVAMLMSDALTCSLEDRQLHLTSRMDWASLSVPHAAHTFICRHACQQDMALHTLVICG